MMMKRLILLLTICLSPILAAAQHGLQVAKIFDDKEAFSHKNNNVTEVRLGGKRLKSYQLTLFRSLKVSHPAPADVARVEAALRQDMKQAVDEQVIRRGKFIYYLNCRLPDRKGLHRYIIYRNNGAASSSHNDFQLIYIEGKATAAELERMFEQ